jgi:hypothetical protein
VTELKQVHTSCQHCCFAVSESGTQTGCKAGRLDAFRAIDPALVVEAENEYGEFYLVNGRTCNLQRHYPWGDGLTDEERLRKARDEVRTKTALVLVLVDGEQEENTTEAVALTLWSARNVAPLPFHEIIVVDNQDRIPAAELRSMVGAAADKSGADTVWRFVTVADREGDGSRITFGRAVDCGLAHLRGSDYYVTARAGDFIPLTLPADLDRACNERLLRFVALDHGDDTGPTVLVAAHRASNVGGHEEVAYAIDDGTEIILESPLDKCRHLAPHRVLPLADVVPECPC